MKKSNRTGNDFSKFSSMISTYKTTEAETKIHDQITI